MSVLEITFRPAAPYDLAQSARSSHDPTRSFRDRTLSLPVPGGTALVRQRHDGELVARIEAVDATAAHDRLRFVLAVDLDHRPFLDLASRDDLLRDVVARRRGHRPLRSSTVAHALVKALCGQLIQGREAAAIERRILRTITGAGPPTAPTTAQVAALAPAVIERCGLAGRRAAALVRVSRSIDLERLHDHPTDRVVARLVRERDLGPWSAGVVTLTGLGRVEHGLVGDLSLVRLLSAIRGRRVEGWETATLLEPYGDWAGLASLHLMAHPLAGTRITTARTAAPRAGG